MLLLPLSKPSGTTTFTVGLWDELERVDRQEHDVLLLEQGVERRGEIFSSRGSVSLPSHPARYRATCSASGASRAMRPMKHMPNSF